MHMLSFVLSKHDQNANKMPDKMDSLVLGENDPPAGIRASSSGAVPKSRMSMRISKKNNQ